MRETWALAWHIVRRNWWVYRKDLLANTSPTLADPAFMIFSLGLGLGSFVAEVEGRSYMAYLAPGLAVSTAMWTSFFETSYGFFVRMTFENIFKAMLTTPIGVREIVYGEFIWVSLKGAFMVTGVALVLFLFGLFKSPTNLWLAPLTGALVAFPLGCIGLLSSCLVRNINQFQSVYSFLIAPIYFFSGIFFPLGQMPETAQWIAKALPLYHGVRLSQAMFWNEDVLATWCFHAPVLLGYSALLFLFTSRQVRRRLQS